MSNVEGVGWPVGLLAAGVAAVVIMSETASPYAPDDFWDSSLFYPTLVALALLCAIGGYCLPTRWLGLGVAAIAPCFVNQLFGFDTDETGSAVFTLPVVMLLGGILIGVARLGAAYREDRERSADR